MLWVDRFIKLPLHMGGWSGNYYPDANTVNISNTKIPFRRRKSSPEFRVKFWTKIAKAHPTLKHFYQPWPCESFINSLAYQDNTPYRDAFEEFYRSGVVKIEDFLNPDDHKTIVELFEKEVDSLLAVQRDAPRIRIKDKSINRMIHRYLGPIEKVLFNKILKQQEYELFSTVVKDGESIYKASTNFHQDTFIPSFKLL